MVPRPVVLLKQGFAPPLHGGSRVFFHELLRRQPPGLFTVLTGTGRAGSEAFDAAQTYRVERRAYLSPSRPPGYLHLAVIQLRCLVDVCRILRRQRGILLLGQMHWSAPLGPAVRALLGSGYGVALMGEELTKLASRRTIASRLQRALARVTLRQASAVVVISSFTRKIALQFGADPSRITLITPGVDSQRFRPDPEKAAPGSPPRLLTVARLFERKGIDTVLAAIPLLSARFPGVTYDVVGEGPDRERLEQLVHERGVGGQVRLLGSVPEAALADLYRRADVFILANRELANADTEGFGIALIEAAASGTPVITGEAGGTGDAMLEGETGLRIDARSATAVAEAISTVLDPENWLRMRERACAFAAEGFSWDRSAERFGSILASVDPRSQPRDTL